MNTNLQDEKEKGMSRQEAIAIVTQVQNRKENWNRDIVSFCGFMDTPEEILAHARRNGWEG